MIVKVRKVGNSHGLTVPKGIPTSNQEYEVFAGRNGAITYLPVTNNPFHDKETLKKYGKYDGDDSGFVDAEVDDDELK